ncbi:MAG: PfkB family carbohydrate kinase, partial [Planctomycetes bacterium]|nr:PfkB family carbohydrate kinase [Planctomycetota bacterium]
MAERDLIGLLEGLFRPRIAVLGDFMLDHYVWGEVERISPEAPVPVVHVGHEEHRLGGAGNVVANLTALGAQPAVFGLRGEDPAGESLKGQLEVLAATGGLLSDTNRPTTQKIRVMARNQQMIRVDREDSASISSAMEQELLKAVCNSSWDALVLSDYGKGVLTPSLIQAVIAEAQTRGVPCLVDPKQRDLSQYRGATVATPNRAEAEGASGCSLGSLEALEAEAPVLLANSGLDALLVTLGPEGM